MNMTHNIHSRPLRIASYNIRKARGLDGRRDPGRIVDVINALDADIIALQEADRRLGDRPAAIPKEMITRATDFDLVPLAQNDVSLGWHGNAILVRRGCQVASTSRIGLPGVEPRGAVAVKLTTGLTVVGVHLGLLRQSRRKQLHRIVGHLGKADNVVVIGDMNEWANARGFEPLAGAFTLHSPGRSFHAARPVAALDRVALSRDLVLSDAGVAQGAQARQASDHLPIWADVLSA
ncbi:endonuclease/exonuclease/phosphatase family metal-dependent hydrolase [Yoonia sediminilitoris]|uniref:Endonuclease/exonuclease/phosphatase family metal-dependent hydrolase n=2 Tax=Yoonia sediminilitoris TaxID=1286148 RepID=A0A2T6KIV4_9RHOB|nr:endonuclease/exonuclease/phosphatase family metal-dependent hydrolase [Yoonia sediminilitoris]RCW96263.1 endonuclease/exonuclease/phosphatase family metal-dependent hydrolase [Yoonia sediminilitoris]